MTNSPSTDATARPWRYEIQYGPNGEKIYAWVYYHNLMVCTAKVHHARLIVEAVNAYEPLKARLAEAQEASVELQRHRDHWRGYAYGKRDRPLDFLDGNLVDADRPQTMVERALAAEDREAVARIIKNHVSVTVSGEAYAPRDNDRDGVASAADAILSLLRPVEPVDAIRPDTVAQRTWFDGENIRTENLTADDIYQKPPTTDDVGEPVAWDHRVLCACENCTEHAPENSVFAREDIGVMPDGTWLCENCYSDCEKTAYGMVANDSDDFEYPRFEDLPRPSLYTHPPKSPDTSAAVLQSHALKQALDCLSEIAAAHIPDCPAHYAGDELSWAQRHVGSLRHKAEIARDGIAAAIRQLPTAERGDK